VLHKTFPEVFTDTPTKWLCPECEHVPDDDTVLLFQYGSNCDEGQINGKNRLRGDAHFISIAQTVDDFKLVFDAWAKGRRCAAADIVLAPANKVWGVLYEIPHYLLRRETAYKRDGRAMDDIEAEGKVYKRESISVLLATVKSSWL
jgi:hypothetical protein